MKKISRNGILIAVCIIILVIMPLSPAMLNSQEDKVKILERESFIVEHTIEFSENDLQFGMINNFDFVKLKDGFYLSELGKPMLPTRFIKIALPNNMAAKSIHVVGSKNNVLEGEFNIFPSQHPLQTSQSMDEVAFIEPDDVIYKSSNPYPSEIVKLIGQSDLAGQGLAEIEIYPVQYIPNESKLVFYHSIQFVIEGEGGYICGDYLPSRLSERSRMDYEQRVQSLVVNKEDVKLNFHPEGDYRTTVLPPGGPYDHVIITSDSYGQYYDPLVEWHTQKGVRDTVVTTEYIYGNYGGADNQEKIRNFVIDAHNTWGTMYFLIGGEHGTVPFEYRTYEGESIPSDQYYGDYDDDWEYEVYVGRVTAEGSTQINCFIEKVLKYEKDPPLTNYPLDITLLGMDLTIASKPPYYTLTAGEDLKEDYIYDDYIPSRFTVTKVYDSHSSNHKTEFLTALNDGQNLVNHNDHSNTNVMGTGIENHGSYISKSNVNSLTNDNRMSVIFSLGCHPNEMDYNDCIAENFVIYNNLQGAVAFTGNTRSGWFYVGEPDSLSGRLDRYWWRGLFPEDEYRLGETLAWTKDHCSYSSQIWKYCQWTLNLLGEPEMPIWTDTPKSFDVSHPSDITTGGTLFTVHVEDGGGVEVEDAYICVWKGDEIYDTGYTNSLGDKSFYITPSTVGSMYVTVTKHNYLPFESTTSVLLGPGQPYIPSNPNPEDETMILDSSVNLGWSGGDPEGDSVTYDVYLGTVNPPPLVATDLSVLSYNSGDLEYGTLYYWYIISNDNNGSYPTYGPIWSFTTITEDIMVVESTEGSPGEQNKIISVTGRWSIDLGSYQMSMYYDPTKIEVIDVTFDGTLGATAAFAPINISTPGMVKAAAIWMPPNFPYPPPGSGMLCNFIINIKPDAALGETILDLDHYLGEPSVKCKYTPPGGASGDEVLPYMIDGVLTITNQMCGDANGYGGIDIDDVVYLINYIFTGGPPPQPAECNGDANGSGNVDIDDVVYLIAYIFSGGTPPVSSCCG